MTSADSALRRPARFLRRRSSALAGSTALRALGVRPFRVYALAQGFTSFGIWMQGITQDWLVLTLTHSAQAVGLTAAFQFLPALLLGPFGGGVADRRPRRRVLQCTQPLTCLLAGSTAVIVLLGSAQPWQIYLLAVLAGLIWVIDNPTRQALVCDLVPPARLRSAVAVNSSIFQSARIVAPAAAGVLITTTGCGPALCVDTLFFALGAFAWCRLRAPAPARDASAREQASTGDDGVFRYLQREPRIAVTILLVGVVGTFGLNFPVVLTVIAQQDYAGSADLYGVFNLALACGSIAGALIAAGRARAGLAQITMLCAVFGAVQLAGALTGDLPAFLACLVALGASNLAFQTVANSAVQLWTEPRWRGRVLGVYGQLFVGGTPLGAPLIGALTARDGGRVGMAVCGSVPLAAALILAAVLAFRREQHGQLGEHEDTVRGRPDVPRPQLVRRRRSGVRPGDRTYSRWMARETGLLPAGEQDGGQDTGLVAPTTRPLRRRPMLIVLLAVVLIAVGALVVWRSSDPGPSPVTRGDVDRAVQSGIQKAQEDERNAPPDAATAFRRILPSLVTVVATHSASRAGAGPGGGGIESDLGTGVVVNASGAILTALHVIDGADRIEVRFTDGTRATAGVVQRRPDNDIAVLAPGRLPQIVVPAVLGGSAQVGETVFPVGNPLGLEDSLTAGVVSALDRSIPTPDGRTLKGLIQFDAAVNPGNSGGPLLDRDGHVVGIVTALANPSHQPYFVGIGFAVPITSAGGAAGGPSK